MLKLLFKASVHAAHNMPLCQPSAWTRRAFSIKPPASSSALLSHIKTKILMRGGPLSIAEYMQDCLTSPQGGFYMGRDVFGRKGDFITSPEISQLFGEMVGIWAVHTWMAIGRPPQLQLVELGPGRGTLMADLLRGTAAFRDFSSCVELHLVELSPVLRARQWEALRCSPREGDGKRNPGASKTSDVQPPGSELHSAGNRKLSTPLQMGSQSTSATTPGGDSRGTTTRLQPPTSESLSPSGPGYEREVDEVYRTPVHGVSGFNGCQVSWHSSLDAVPDGRGPALYIAHEFFDALPVHQFVRDPVRGWLEKMVDVDLGYEGHQEQQLQAPSLHRPNNLRSNGLIESSGSPCSSAQSESEGTIDSFSKDSSIVSSCGLRMVLSPGPTPASSILVPRRLSGLPDDKAQQLSALEVSAVGMATAERLAQCIGRRGGAALLVDYGREELPYGDSLMAIQGHRGVGILDSPGSADLSAWVDFGALKMAAAGASPSTASTTTAVTTTATGTSLQGPPVPQSESPVPSTTAVGTSGPVSQAAFLRALGVETRLQWLMSRAANPEAAAALAAGCSRLLGGSADGGMGESYKVMAIHQGDLRDMAGFS